MISSLSFSEAYVTKEYTFTANKMYCTNPDYSSTTFNYSGNNIMGFIFKYCFQNGEQVKYKNLGITFTGIKKSSYDNIVLKEYPYLFFKDGSKIHVKEYSNNVVIFSTDVWSGEGNYWFKYDNVYPSRDEWEK